MQEIILENLVKWFSNLDFSLSKQNDKLSFTCKELNIEVKNLPKEEFITEVLEKGIDGVEKFFNLKVLGIDLRELFGIKPKTNSKQEVKQPETSTKTEKSPKDWENWIKEELEKAFKQGDLEKIKDPMQDLFENWRKNKSNFPDYRLNWMDSRFPWNQVICLANLK